MCMYIINNSSDKNYSNIFMHTTLSLMKWDLQSPHGMMMI